MSSTSEKPLEITAVDGEELDRGSLIDDLQRANEGSLIDPEGQHNDYGLLTLEALSLVHDQVPGLMPVLGELTTDSSPFLAIDRWQLESELSAQLKKELPGCSLNEYQSVALAMALLRDEIRTCLGDIFPLGISDNQRELIIKTVINALALTQAEQGPNNYLRPEEIWAAVRALGFLTSDAKITPVIQEGKLSQEPSKPRANVFGQAENVSPEIIKEVKSLLDPDCLHLLLESGMLPVAKASELVAELSRLQEQAQNGAVSDEEIKFKAMKILGAVFPLFHFIDRAEAGAQDVSRNQINLALAALRQWTLVVSQGSRVKDDGQRQSLDALRERLDAVCGKLNYLWQGHNPTYNRAVAETLGLHTHLLNLIAEKKEPSTALAVSLALPLIAVARPELGMATRINTQTGELMLTPQIVKASETPERLLVDALERLSKVSKAKLMVESDVLIPADIAQIMLRRASEIFSLGERENLFGPIEGDICFRDLLASIIGQLRDQGSLEPYGNNGVLAANTAVGAALAQSAIMRVGVENIQAAGVSFRDIISLLLYSDRVSQRGQRHPERAMSLLRERIKEQPRFTPAEILGRLEELYPRVKRSTLRQIADFAWQAVHFSMSALPDGKGHALRPIRGLYLGGVSGSGKTDIANRLGGLLTSLVPRAKGLKGKKDILVIPHSCAAIVQQGIVGAQLTDFAPKLIAEVQRRYKLPGIQQAVEWINEGNTMVVIILDELGNVIAAAGDDEQSRARVRTVQTELLGMLNPESLGFEVQLPGGLPGQKTLLKPPHLFTLITGSLSETRHVLEVLGYDHLDEEGLVKAGIIRDLVNRIMFVELPTATVADLQETWESPTSQRVSLFENIITLLGAHHFSVQGAEFSPEAENLILEAIKDGVGKQYRILDIVARQILTALTWKLSTEKEKLVGMIKEVEGKNILVIDKELVRLALNGILNGKGPNRR